MKIRSIALAACLTTISLVGIRCSEPPQTENTAKTQDASVESAQVALKGEMETVAAKIVQKVPREQSYADVKVIVSKYPEKALLEFVADKYREIDRVPARRIVSQLAQAGFEKFGTANWQFYHAFYVGTGVDTPPDPIRALAILDMPATGTMRSSLTLRAKMLMRLDETSNAPDARIEELLRQASEQGDGEATKLLDEIKRNN